MKCTPQKITLYSGIGLGAYIIGGITLVLGAYLVFLQTYYAGIFLILAGFFLLGFRMKVELNRETMMITKRTGLFWTFFPRIKRSITGTTAVVLSRHPSHYNFATNMKAASSYTLELEHPDGNIPIDYFDQQKKGYDTGHFIAKWLQVKFYQNLVK